MSVGIVTLLLLALLVSGISAPAEATGPKITVKSGAHFNRNAPGHIHHTPRPQGHIHFTPRTQGHIHFTPSTQGDTHFQHRQNGIHRHIPSVVVPHTVYVTPRTCAVPGYWAYTWVPQSYVSNVWVPAHYNADALWVDGHYAPRAYTWGYYQPYWVPESWTYC